MKSLHQETLQLLRNTHLTRREIAAAVGVSESWLSKFKHGRFGEPGVNTTEALHDFLLNVERQQSEKRA